MSTQWPLTGRAHEVRVIEAALGEGGLVLAGAAGVGKTRLARETVAAARSRGCLTHWIAASAAAHALPLGAFAGVVDVVPDIDHHVVRQVMRSLVQERESAAVVIAVDDAHLLDPLSAFIVHQLATQQLATVVMTVRTDDPATESVAALWKDAPLQRVEVRPLSEAATVELVTAVLNGPLEPDVVRRMWSLTLGNVLYLRQLVDEQVAAKRLRFTDGCWRWHGDPIVSDGLAELVSLRMGALSEATSELVDTLALAEPLDIDLLAELTEPTAVERAESDGLLTVSPVGDRLHARLAHPLYGEVRRRHLGAVRARRLRGRIALGLAKLGDAQTPEQTLRRAVLLADSDLSPDPTLLVSGSRCAARLLDFVLAERLGRSAVAAGAGFEARISHAFGLSMLGRGEEAERELAAMARAAISDEERVDTAIVRAANMMFDLSRSDAAMSVIDDAQRSLEGPRGLPALTAWRAIHHATQGRAEPAMEAADKALASGTIPDIPTMLASWAAVLAAGLTGATDRIAAAAAVGYARAAVSSEAALLGFILSLFQILAQRWSGDLAATRRIADTVGMQYADLPGDSPGMVAIIRGYSALGGGDLRVAGELFRTGVAAISEAFARTGWSFIALLEMTTSEALLGHAAVATELLERAEAQRHPAFRFLEPDVLLARAWVSAAHGTTSVAVRHAEEAAVLARGLGQCAVEVMALQTMVRLGDSSPAGRLRELATTVASPRARVAANHSAALAARDGAGLDSASREYQRMGDKLAAADAAAQASLAHTGHGLRGSALAAAVRAAELAEACGGAHTPALLAAANPVPLTAREREIALLAARGLSNREISGQLVISVRTVEGHLYRISTKLGGVGRTELGRFLRLPQA
ncbi:LuxR C-terminal-related transcriptional regulator [Nocardia gipuzkoensis]